MPQHRSRLRAGHGPRRRIRRGLGSTAIITVCSSVVLAAPPPPSSAGTTTPWTAYLFDPSHQSRNAADGVIKPTNAASLVAAWPRFNPPAGNEPGQPDLDFFSGPVIDDGKVLIGSDTGVFYAVDEATGQVLWSRLLGYQTQKTCSAYGITSTATVATDPATSLPTAYVAAGDGYLYALDVATGNQVWRSLVVDPGTASNKGMNWSSPTVAGGRVYMGMSSNCDAPLIRGGVRAYDQATGTLLATHYTVRASQKGGSVWSSVAVPPDGQSIFVTTGNPKPNSTDLGQTNSILKLDAVTLALQDSWMVPQAEQIPDGDFGASPTVWRATIGTTTKTLIGACNKNGIFYALDANDLAAGPMWKLTVGTHVAQGGLCLAGAVFDGSHLYIAGPQTTIAGTTYEGGIRAVDPATGAILWETGLPGAAEGSPSMGGSGVLAVPTYDQSTTAVNAVYLVKATNGTILASVARKSKTFAQPAFADGLLFVGTLTTGLRAYRPGP